MPAATASRDVYVEQVMGTVVSLDARAGDAHGVPASLAWLRDVDARFSPFRADSEIRRLDRGDLLPLEASSDVRWVLERCEALRRETAGHFDVRARGTLDPSALVKGWA